MRFVNLTPHEITVVKSDGDVVKIPPSGMVLRLEEEDVESWEEDGFRFVRRRFGLPQVAQTILDSNDEDLVLIVSLPTLLSLKDHTYLRGRVAAPDTGSGAIRDEKGQVVATTRLIML